MTGVWEGGYNFFCQDTHSGGEADMKVMLLRPIASNISNYLPVCKWRAEQYWWGRFCSNYSFFFFLLQYNGQCVVNSWSTVYLWLVFPIWVSHYLYIVKCSQLKKQGLGLQTVSMHCVSLLPFSFWDVMMISSCHHSDLSFTESTVGRTLFFSQATLGAQQ